MWHLRSASALLLAAAVRSFVASVAGRDWACVDAYLHPHGIRAPLRFAFQGGRHLVGLRCGTLKSGGAETWHPDSTPKASQPGRICSDQGFKLAQLRPYVAQLKPSLLHVICITELQVHLQIDTRLIFYLVRLQ